MLLRRFKSKIQFSLLLAAALIFAALLCALISQADFSDDEDASVSLTESGRIRKIRPLKPVWKTCSARKSPPAA